MPNSNQHKEHVEAIREESALLADWAEMSGDARPSSVDVDEVRGRLMAAADSLFEQLETREAYIHTMDAAREVASRRAQELQEQLEAAEDSIKMLDAESTRLHEQLESAQRQADENFEAMMEERQSAIDFRKGLLMGDTAYRLLQEQLETLRGAARELGCPNWPHPGITGCSYCAGAEDVIRRHETGCLCDRASVSEGVRRETDGVPAGNGDPLLSDGRPGTAAAPSETPAQSPATKAEG